MSHSASSVVVRRRMLAAPSRMMCDRHGTSARNLCTNLTAPWMVPGHRVADSVSGQIFKAKIAANRRILSVRSYHISSVFHDYIGGTTNLTGNVECAFTANTQRGDVGRITADFGQNQISETGAQTMEILSAVVRDASNNPLPNVQVRFKVEEGEALFADTPGATPSADGKSIDLFTDKNGVVGVRPTLGNTPGVIRVSAQALRTSTGSFDTSADIVSGAQYTIRAKQAQDGPASFVGVVYADKGNPLAGVRVSIGRTALSSTTDAQGKFQLDNVPPGRIDLFVDGRTMNPTNDASRPQYPSLHFEAYAVKGQQNQLAHAIYLPALAAAQGKVVGGNEDVILTIEGLEGFQMKVKANSVTFPDGSRVGTLIVSPVTADKLPMAPPAGGAQFGVPAWTIQPAGTRFDPPIEVQMPNATLEVPGDNLPVVQWDHDLNQYVPMGRATVSADGAFLITDAGSGLTKAGWGGLCRYDECKTALTKCPDCQKIEMRGSPPCPTCASDIGKNGAGCEGDECKECKNGVCAKKPDKELGTAEQKIDLQVFQRYLDGISDKLNATMKSPILGSWVSGGSAELSRPTITGGVSETIIERCCEGKTTTGVKVSGTLEFSPGGLSVRIRPPTWRVPNPFEPAKDLAGIGALVEVRVSMAGSGSGVKADCDCSYAVFICGQARLTLVAYIDVNSSGRTMSGSPLPGDTGPRLLDIQGGLSVSMKAGAKLDCNGFTPDSYQFGPLEFVAKIRAGDFIEKSVRIPIDGTTFAGP